MCMSGKVLFNNLPFSLGFWSSVKKDPWKWARNPALWAPRFGVLSLLGFFGLWQSRSIHSSTEIRADMGGLFPYSLPEFLERKLFGMTT